MLILGNLQYIHFSFVYKERLKEIEIPKFKKDGVWIFIEIMR